jgi:hypothetical protein
MENGATTLSARAVRQTRSAPRTWWRKWPESSGVAQRIVRLRVRRLMAGVTVPRAAPDAGRVV